MPDNLYFIAPLSIIGSLALVIFLIPKIIWIVNSLNLIDHPDDRSSHKNSTPTMAGISFFLTLVFSLFFINIWNSNEIVVNLIAALTLIFAVGLKDDLVLSSPKAKIGAEILSICLILFCKCMHIPTLDGFLGIQGIPPFVSYGLIIFMLLVIINSFNLIDGIDGLASIIGILIISIYALIFFATGLDFYFLLSLSLIGILVGFLRFNLSSSKKIFMGDTGSLIIGFCIGFFTLKFLSMDASLFKEYSFHPENKLIVIASILYIPLFDTIRVIGIRLLNKKSPFYPDRNHVHHILIDSGLTHYKVSLFLGLLNLSLAILFIILSFYTNSYQLLAIYIVSFLLLLGIFYKLKNNVVSRNKFKHVIMAIQFLF